ncbi:bifunctional 23S rRNA (guanine(2069)-N(7))-methyltransferase RlmK/23S rRNA (guanine(2445)-N(2))-methyltransferase RlmL [Marinobacterium sedimentorum]|uniref:bifunctional 23S rRNA (guanine(2069)-N(7))-methyltransferase RlmK/23S rRNA (guanine(2445)-N(2))-methyltransferase RlmL n=1 Tax=Marinobacterium sedimentorum TaxID=2927804 RepID=UPI0020C61EFC|nr:bifunctional 23S rRNA (guanine(2069)-N(7))-methyltransferase RlmK/23S rRNA (guanine(2445)-N(2))-methyltransferase RlmL [Marinobacterium sedimentorum]MCP8687000.1 bifunctional 23S rRNA (guanine(2069)-N(7))-methyltransferase RlmK/23S rRNA (guanine(2445)-N(2))-methyltransferase RlmL [Marinobacterium sedimentorum]
MNFFVTCPKGIEGLLLDELKMLGMASVKETQAGVYFDGELRDAYRVCLWSRLANRVLLPLQVSPVNTADELYEAVQQVQWLDHLRPLGTLSVDFTGRTEQIINTHFGAQRVKDAVVDQIRAATGNRPTVDRAEPDLGINVHLYSGKATIALDLSGGSLHRRGYRKRAGQAPMKENLAAAVLYRAGWPQLAATHPQLLDPMCGSGTLLIEAAMMAADVAPGLLRQRFGFSRWLQHDKGLWRELHAEAVQRRDAGLAALTVRFTGYDRDASVLQIAAQNSERAGLAGVIDWREQDMVELGAPAPGPGLLVTNPPYAERIGDETELMYMYRQMGERLKRQFGGWKVAIFSGNAEQCKVIGLKVDRQYKLYNGAIECGLFLFTLHAERDRPLPLEQGAPVSEQAQMFANRLKKNLKALSKWLKREQIECYRLYDADMPEYAVAVDCYGDWVHVQEYAPPSSIDPRRAFERLQDVISVIPEVLGVKPERVVLKQRRRQQGSSQYGRQGQTDHFVEVQEHGCKLRVNLHDYLDTGLFLDHRPVRRRIQALALGKDVLNLFCYTATASVHAAMGGAESTTSVDMSATYLGWAMKNMGLNGFAGGANQFIQADCIKWLNQPRAAAFDLIFMDPPTFSNSKRMEEVLDIQRDHVSLVQAAMKLLRPGGVLLFSNNYRRFVLDYEALADFDIQDITAKTLDPDFKRSKSIHVCFEIRHRAG